MNNFKPEQLDANGKPLIEKACGVCGYLFDAATSRTTPGARPKPGDLSCCMKCGEIYRFNEKLELEIPTVGQLAALDQETMAELTWVQNRIRRYRVLG
jgi:hypothetical protein